MQIQPNNKGRPEHREDFLEDEVFVDLNPDDLCNEISAKTNIPVETIKTILDTFVRHQIQVMKL